MPTTLRNEIRARKSHLLDQRAEARKERDAAKQLVPNDSTGAPDTASPGFRRLSRAVERLESIDAELEQVSTEENGAVFGANGNGNRNASGSTDLVVFNDPEFKREIRDVATSTSRSKRCDIELAHFPPETVASWTGKSLAAAPVAPPTPGMEQPAMTRMVPYPTPPTSFLDVVPSATTERPADLFGQEVSTGAGPAPAAPGSVKPLVGLEYVDVEATSETIAGYMKMNRQTLDDIAGLQQMAQYRMMTFLRQELEHEVLVGTGAVSDITGKAGIVGVLNQTGLGSVPVGSGTGWLPPDDILDGIVTCLVSGARPNIVVMNHVDWATLMKTKSAGSGEYLSSPFLSTVSQVWNVPLVPSVAMPPGKILVGDTRIGLTLLVREGANLRISDADTDDMTRNKVTLLCEGRWSLAVYVPAAFCVVG